MAKKLTHKVDYSSEGWFPSNWMLNISYGECETSAYAKDNLWFVTIPQGRLNDLKAEGKSIDELIAKDVRLDEIFPEEDMTFLVAKKYTQKNIINDWKRNIKAWEKVAHYFFIGDWCAELEQLWKDVPIYKHSLPTGQEIKYGYCRTTKEQRTLWFVSFKDGGSDHAFIIDEVCASVDFLDHLGTNPRKWLPLCWCYLEDEVKAQWDDLQTGKDVKWFQQYQLDSPYTLDEINKQIESYQNEIKSKI